MVNRVIAANQARARGAGASTSNAYEDIMYDQNEIDTQVGITTVLEVGARIRVHGLETEAGKAYNGAEGFVKVYSEETGRWKIECDDGKILVLKADNLTVFQIDGGIKCEHKIFCFLLKGVNFMAPAKVY